MKNSRKKRGNRAGHTRKELKRKAVNYKGGKCEACGYNKCLAALSFHHKDPKEKDFNISDLMPFISWKAIKKEISRCYLLCLNCHCEVHAGLLDGYMGG